LKPVLKKFRDVIFTGFNIFAGGGGGGGGGGGLKKKKKKNK